MAVRSNSAEGRAIVVDHSFGEAVADAPSNLREEGRLRVLRALYTSVRTSRPELVRATGLSRATVSAIISDLMAGGLVAEDADPLPDPGRASDGTGAAEPRRIGRPAQALSLVPTAAYAAGVDIGHEHVRTVLCDLQGTPLWDRVVAKEVDGAPGETLDLAAALLDESVRACDVPRQRVLGVGLGIASPVDKTTGALGVEGIMPGWIDTRPGEELARRTGLPARLTNDANAGAIAEHLYGAGRGAQDMVYVRLSAGIGAGVVANGRLLLGASGLVGEIGHLRADREGGRVCRCGNRGCLETVASPIAVARLLAGSWDRPVAAADLTRLLRTGSRGVARAIEDAGFAVGRALAALVTLFNPELIVVGGDLAAAGETVLAPIRASVHRHALPSAANDVTVRPGALGPQAEVRGAAALVLADAPRALAVIAAQP